MSDLSHVIKPPEAIGVCTTKVGRGRRDEIGWRLELGGKSEMLNKSLVLLGAIMTGDAKKRARQGGGEPSEDGRGVCWRERGRRSCLAFPAAMAE